MNCRRYPGLIGLAGNHSDAGFVSKNLSHIWKLSRFGACAIALSDTCGNLKHRRCFNSACALSTRSSQQVICSVCVHIASYWRCSCFAKSSSLLLSPLEELLSDDNGSLSAAVNCLLASSMRMSVARTRWLAASHNTTWSEQTTSNDYKLNTH